MGKLKGWVEADLAKGKQPAAEPAAEVTVLGAESKGFLEQRRERKELERATKTEVMGLVEEIVADDFLSEEEEASLVQTLDAKGWTIDQVAETDIALYDRLFIAKLNAGRLPEADSHSIMLKKGEVVHEEVLAALAKEVVDRQWRGGGSGVSFRVAKGVHFRTGQMRGKSVVVGSHIERADEGPLTITSKRVVFQGTRRTVECAYSKLIGLKLYSDAIQISVSNRQTPTTLFVPKPELVAALINAAMQKE